MKIFKIVITTLIVAGWIFVLGLILFLWKMNVSSIFLEREWRERFDKKTYQVTTIIHNRNNNRDLSLPIKNLDWWPEWKKFGTAFDTKWDILFYNDPNKQYIDYNTISGNRNIFSVPVNDKYEIWISVCQQWFLECETQYYNNPKCVELVYVPDFYERKREKIVDWCEVVDISNWWRDQIFYSIKY